MSDCGWDDDNFVPAPVKKDISDKWDGEDEEPVKDSWEDTEEEKVANPVASTDKRKKKKLVDIIAAKEKKKLEDIERRRREREEERKNMTPEGQLAEKLRVQKVQEEADLALVSDLVGNDEEDCSALDDLDLSDKDDLESFRKTLIKKIRSSSELEKELHYVSFVEELSRELCQNMESDDIRKIATILNTLCNEKMKSSKSNARSKKKGTSKLNLGKGSTAEPMGYEDYGEYDDFI